uniref:Homing endonuclease n=1 Tax=Mammaliicoccus phage MSShimriz1 TaxID=3230127 RepID=A0AAU8GVH3_9VIRU
MKYYNENDIYYSETATGIVNYIDLSNLPKRGKSFDWKNTNHQAPFRYLDNEGTLHIKFSPSESKTPLVELTYQDVTFTMQANNLKRVKLNYLTTQNKRYTMQDHKVGDIVKGCEILAIKKNNEKYIYLLYNIKEEVYGTLSNQELKTFITDSYVPHSTVPQSKMLYHHKHIHQYVNNREDLFNHRYTSRKRISTTCPNCLKEKKVRVVDLVQDSYTCTCRKSYSSFGERVTQAYLDILNVPYVREHKFKDLGLKRFDFYLPDSNTVVEVHGIQHYQEVTGYMSHKITKESDILKKQYCKDNDITYIEVDARKSTFKHIIRSLNQYTYIDPELIKNRYREVYSK